MTYAQNIADSVHCSEPYNRADVRRKRESLIELDDLAGNRILWNLKVGYLPLARASNYFIEAATADVLFTAISLVPLPQVLTSFAGILGADTPICDLDCLVANFCQASHIVHQGRAIGPAPCIEGSPFTA